MLPLSTIRPRLPALSGIVLTALVGGCQPTGTPVAPGIPENSRFSGSGTEAVPDAWWQAFGDRRLNALEKRALRRNFDLESAWQRLQQAQAIARREGAALIPNVDAFAAGEVDRIDFNGERLELGLAASYEVDLWGGIRSRKQAAQLRSRARLADYRAAAISLSAEVAATWYGLVEAQQQLQLIGDQIATNERILDQLKVRLKQGQGGGVDVIRQEQLLRATREQLTFAESTFGLLRHRLGVLQGGLPSTAIAVEGSDLPELPALPRTGLPAELLKRRPDVLAALYELQAADRDLATAFSERLPRLVIGASLTSADGNAGKLLDDWLGQVVGELVAPLIDGGARRAEVDRARARMMELLADTRQTMLVALREVEDGLLLDRTRSARIRELRGQLDLARRSNERLLQEYLNGAGSFIDVLSSLREQQALQRDLLEARRLLIESRIGLYRALAGSIPNHR